MTWTAYHRRTSALRTVTAVADDRRDGEIPWDALGSDADAFESADDLLLALQMRWFNRLSGRLEAELHEQPLDLGDAVARAWRQTASELPGTRLILDAHESAPALRAAQDKELALLASAAGLASLDDPRAPMAGRSVETEARGIWIERGRPRDVHTGWFNRLRGALVA